MHHPTDRIAHTQCRNYGGSGPPPFDLLLCTINDGKTLAAHPRDESLPPPHPWPLKYSCATAHTTAFVTPVVEHWLEREIAQWVHHERSIRRPIAP